MTGEPTVMELLIGGEKPAAWLARTRDTIQEPGHRAWLAGYEEAIVAVGATGTVGDVYAEKLIVGLIMRERRGQVPFEARETPADATSETSQYAEESQVTRNVFEYEIHEEGLVYVFRGPGLPQYANRVRFDRAPGGESGYQARCVLRLLVGAFAAGRKDAQKEIRAALGIGKDDAR